MGVTLYGPDGHDGPDDPEDPDYHDDDDDHDESYLVKCFLVDKNSFGHKSYLVKKSKEVKIVKEVKGIDRS